MSRNGAGTTSTWLTPAALGGWALLIAIAWLWGSHLNQTLANPMLVNAPPLTGQFGLRLEPWVLLPLLATAAAVWWLPHLGQRLSFRWLLVVSVLVSAAWIVALAVSTGGPSMLTRPLANPFDTLADLARVTSPGTFLDGFVANITDYTSHTRGHPPGMLLTFWAMEALGLGGKAWAATLEILGGATTAAAVMVALREVSSERIARSAFPFLVITPAAVFMSTTADALFAGVAAWAVALLILATGAAGKKQVLLSLAGGMLIAWGFFLSYGLVLIGIIPIVVAVSRRTWRPLAIAAIPAAAMTLMFASAGFWWFDGLGATREQYLLGVARYRPGGYFLLANLAALAVAAGPATAAGLARLRDRGTWLLVGGALAAIAIADLSGMSKAEVERIWLPFTVWLFAACASLSLSGGLSRSPRATRVWLGAQAASALLVQLVVRN